MRKKDLEKEIQEAIKSKPSNWRDGQFVFNYIDAKYRVARDVQYIDNVDCFFLDEKIDDFIEKCAERIKNS